MPNKYEIQGLKFQLKEPNLDARKVAMNFQSAINTEFALSTLKIDFSPLEIYEDRLAELTEAKIQCEDIIKTGKIDGVVAQELEIEERKSMLVNINLSIAEQNKLIKSNVVLNNLFKLKKEKQSEAQNKVIFTSEVVMPFLETVLEGDNPNKINFIDNNAVLFLGEVTKDFFTLLNLRIKEFSSSGNETA